MRICRLVAAVVLAAAFAASVARGQPVDRSRYPALDGQWVRNIGAHWDASKPPTAQEAPLTPEYQSVFEDNWAGFSTGHEDPGRRCLPAGMPRMMIAFYPIQVILTPDTTYVRAEEMGESRRIYTDGRAWPEHRPPAFLGYSIGRWVDEDGDGRYDVLLVETRGFKGPRMFDTTGVPLHKDNQTIVRERIISIPPIPICSTTT